MKLDLLPAQLAAIASDSFGYEKVPPAHPPLSRAAVLALFRGTTFPESEILLILRAKHLSVHAGEVAFPGGGTEIEDEGNATRTALRECFEEVGVPSSHVQTFGALPMLVTVSGKVAVDPVLAYYASPLDLPLTIDPQEVSGAEWVKVHSLRQSRKYETRHTREGVLELPYFQWGSEKMWGLTALIFDLILKRYDRLLA